MESINAASNIVLEFESVRYNLSPALIFFQMASVVVIKLVLVTPLKVIDCAVPLKSGVFTRVSQTVAAVP